MPDRHNEYIKLKTTFEGNLDLFVATTEDQLIDQFNDWLKATVKSARFHEFGNGWFVEVSSVVPGTLRATFRSTKEEDAT